MQQVSLFNGFADKNPKPITIHEVVEIIRADQRLQVLTDNHRRYALNDDDDENENLHNGVMLSNAKHLAQCNEDKSLSENNCEILDFSPYGFTPRASTQRFAFAQDDKHNVKHSTLNTNL